MVKAKVVKTKVESVPVVSFSKEAQLNPRKPKKKAIPEPVKVEQPKVEPPAPVITEAPVETKVDDTPKAIPDGVSKWLAEIDTITPADFPRIAATLLTEIDALNKDVAEIKEVLAHKRKPVANGKVQIKDTETGIVYKSKNNVYQTLLKNNDLADLVSQGVFGADPKKNSFGWYALNRAFPDRFIEVKAPEASAQK